MVTLRGLAPADWGKEAVPGWTVRDLAAHILGDFYGRLARDRDGHQEGPAFAAGETLESFIHRINQEWVDAYRRVSPSALADTLDLVGGQVARFSRPPISTPRRWGCPGPGPTRRRCGWTAPATSPSSGLTASRSATPSARTPTPTRDS
ncbi:maleylpyruvate isomerase N-terminal domain-containing protein [Streptomyces roseoverticillatus]|uniref:maleylpyruvate isomerase N-terminal domain-containing protein n=1 Tax=Streptomyces roseoverticillatus TaxID=66429 RepID=UPI0033C01E7E